MCSSIQVLLLVIIRTAIFASYPMVSEETGAAPQLLMQ